MAPKQIPTPLPLGWFQSVIEIWRETGGERMLHLADQLETIVEENPRERCTRSYNLITNRPMRTEPRPRRTYNSFKEYLYEPN